MRSRSSFLALGWILLLLAACPVRAQDPAESASPAKNVTRPSGKDALRKAFEIRKQSYKKKGEEKRQILLRAVTAYETVAGEYADDPKTASTAFLRAGDLCRSLDQADRALKLYESAAGFADQPRNAARALSEIAHILRRAGKNREAITGYRGVVQRFPKEQDHAVRALLWIGKLEKIAGNGEAARKAWSEAISGYGDPKKRLIECYDQLALSHVEGGKLDRARELLSECRTRFDESFRSDRRADREVVAAFERMKVRKRIEGPPAEPAPEPSGEKQPDAPAEPDGSRIP